MAEKILIVEDEEKLARFVELELAHEGYQVEKALTAGRGSPGPRRATMTCCCWTSCSRA